MNVLSAFRSLALFSLSVNSTEQRLMRSHLELFSRGHVWGKNEGKTYVLSLPFEILLPLLFGRDSA